MLDKRVTKEIQKLEKDKALKTELKSKLETEINEISNQLKELYAFRSNDEKNQSSIDKFFNPCKDNES